FGMLLVHPFIFKTSWWRQIFLFGVIRQRRDGLRKRSVVIAVLDPPVSHDHKVALPASLKWRLLRKPQSHLVAGIHDNVAIINLGQKLSHISKSRVITSQVAPFLFRCFQVIVVGNFWRRVVGLMNRRVAAIM